MPEPDPEDDRKIQVEEKFLRLRELLRAKSDLRKMLSARRGHLVPTGKECNPRGDVAGPKYEGGHSYVGILVMCGSPDEYCVDDPSSKLGGICARVVSEDAAATDSATKGGSKEHTHQLKPLTRNDKLKAKHLLKQSKVGREGSAVTTEDECTPSIGAFELNKRSIDVGILNGGCKKVGNICAKDPSSSLGGICVDITSSSETTLASYSSNHEIYGHLTSCYYTNGTAGTKCSGVNSCGRLDPSFIASNVGCGSCNAYRSCSGMTCESFKIIFALSDHKNVALIFSSATSSVGEGSCNAGNACRGNTGETSAKLESNFTSCISAHF